MIVIPKSFKDVKVKDYIALQPFLKKEYDNPISKSIDLLSVFNDKSDVLKQKPSELGNLDFLFAEPNREFTQYFKINSKSYGIVNQIEDLDAGQYMSFTTYLKGFEDNPNIHIDSMHDILSTVIFPVDENKNVLNIEPSYFKKLSKDIYEHMSIYDAYPIAIFFCNLSRSLMNFTQTYLSNKYKGMTKEAKELMLETMKDLMNDGAGLSPSITSAMETLRKDLTTKK